MCAQQRFIRSKAHMLHVIQEQSIVTWLKWCSGTAADAGGTAVEGIRCDAGGCGSGSDNDDDDPAVGLGIDNDDAAVGGSTCKARSDVVVECVDGGGGAEAGGYVELGLRG